LIRDETDMVELNKRKAQEANLVQRLNRIDEPTPISPKQYRSAKYVYYQAH
jgi:hypothetical protein